MKASRTRVFVFLLAALLSGCLPSSCSRVESRDLFPADSLSRSIAASLPVDTLRVVYDTADREVNLQHPRTVVFDAKGTLYASDVAANDIVTLNSTGDEASRVQLDDIVAPESIPYLIGTNGDTLNVFFAGANRLGQIHANLLVSSFALSVDDAAKQLRYAASSGDSWWLKTVDPDSGSQIVLYNAQGERQAATGLPGPYWSHAGPLRLQRDTVISVRGYQPGVVRLSAAGVIDSLRLSGFDSPMLARMRAYRLGDAKNPPLLIPSIAIADARLFAINVRPGWLRVDVFDEEGILKARLVEPDPGFDKSFFPTDISVHRQESGSYLIAVSVTDPAPAVRLYSWLPH